MIYVTQIAFQIFIYLFLNPVIQKSVAAGQSGSSSSSANVRPIDNKRKRKLSCSDEDGDESQ